MILMDKFDSMIEQNRVSKVDAGAERQSDSCPIVSFVNLISGKWAIPVLYRLMVINKSIRFNELQRAIAPITQKELTRQLRLFESRGLVQRTVYAEVPPRVEYLITDLGKTLKPTLDSLANWMKENKDNLSKHIS